MFRAEMPASIRACLTTPATDANREIQQLCQRDSQGLTSVDTWIRLLRHDGDSTDQPWRGRPRVTSMITTVRQETEEIQGSHLKEAHDDRAYLNARVNSLYRDRPYHCHTALALDREAVYARVAWASSEEGTQLTTTLGRIATLEARDPEPQDGPAETVAAAKMPPRRTTRATPATTTTPTTTVTDAQLQALIDRGVAAALAERDASKSRDGDNSHDSEPAKKASATQRECTYTTSEVPAYEIQKQLNWKDIVGLTRPDHGSVKATITVTSGVNCPKTEEWKSMGIGAGNGNAVARLMTCRVIHQTRQGNFQIDLIPGAAPVARAPYRLAPSEMKELLDQLKELSDKGFINTHSSPWGASVLYIKKKVLFGSCQDLIRSKIGASQSHTEIRSILGQAATTEDSLKIHKIAKPMNQLTQKKPLRFGPLVYDIGFGPSPIDIWRIRLSKEIPENLKSEDVGGSLVSPRYGDLRTYYAESHEDREEILDREVRKSKRKSVIPPSSSSMELPRESSLISLSRGSFDVIVGMDWLSKRDFVIVYHEKVVRVPLEGDEIFLVHGECTLGAAKALMNAKLKEEHEFHLKLVLESLRKEKLYAKFSKLSDALSRKERVKSGRVRGMILAAQSEAFKQESVLAERLWFRSTDGKKRRREFTDKVSSFSSYTRRFQDVKLARIYIDEIIARNGILHPQADGQSERMIQTLEDIMRACVVDFGGSYQLSIRCAPFEALYGRKCRSPVLWAEIGGSSLIGPELVQEMTDKVVLVKEKPKAVRDRQKSYVDYRRKPLEFEVGDRVLLKVTPWKGVVHFGKKGKLAPRYVGPFEILERIGLVAYRLRLPEELNSVHDTFHVSNLKKCLADANLHVPLDEIKVDKTLRFVEEPVEIMDREIKKLKRRKIALVKVRWNSKRGPEFTWEHEDQMRIKYPQLFVDRVVEPAS
ncbi:putative reverse transcriptase domain-containing protein [Tanacetum coccineum]